MKATIMTLGMLMILSPSSFAAPAARASLQETMKTHSEKIKEAAFGKGASSAQGMGELALKKSQDQLVNWLKLNGTESNKLTSALNMDGPSRAKNLDTLASIVAVKEMVRGGSITDMVEAKSLDNAATATARLLLHSRLVGKMPIEMVKELDGVQFSEATSALKKLTTMPESILMEFGTKDRNSYTEILNRHDELVNSNSKSPEENFVQAIMDVKQISKEKAMELVRRLKTCE